MMTTADRFVSAAADRVVASMSWALDPTEPRGWILTGAIAGAIVAVFTVLGLLWAVLKPWLRDQIIGPVHETRAAASEARDAVTVNGHTSEIPTVLDLLRDVLAGQERIRGDVADNGRRLDAHIRLTRSHEREVDRRFDDVDNRIDTHEHTTD
jgi:hypothetical protein